MTAITQEAVRRRTFAVISHPDAGKSTMTEALALHASAISEAGAVHGKAGRRGVTSDWMDMEKARGISITSAALRFEYRGHMFNLVDTPGHADFSEDTYRVLAAVDCAVMLLDAAKGMEPQTLKLFEVCRHRRIPVITFVNKWDRPGREALELLDEIQEKTGLRPTPITWPIGTGGFFHGVVDRAADQAVRYTRTPGGATKAIETALTADEALAELGEDWERAKDEVDLLSAIGSDHDQKAFEAHESTPVLFGAALNNFGVGRLLDAMVDIAPAPAPRPDAKDVPRPLERPFSGLVFKVQANMDPSHRDRIAFVRVCSGRFERGMVLTHAATGRPFATKYAQSVFGQERATIDEAFPGDVVGLVNATALRPGDTVDPRELVTELTSEPLLAQAVSAREDLQSHRRFRVAHAISLSLWNRSEQERTVGAWQPGMTSPAAPFRHTRHKMPYRHKRASPRERNVSESPFTTTPQLNPRGAQHLILQEKYGDRKYVFHIRKIE